MTTGLLQQRSSDVDHLTWLSKLSSSKQGSWQSKHILDLGCGSGFVCQEAMRRGASFALGLDLVSPPGLAAEDSWRFMQLDLDGDEWPSIVATRTGQLFDTALAFDILEHVSSPWTFLQGVYSLLGPGGRLVLTTPNVNSWERLWRPQAWSGVQDPQHKILFSAYSLKFLLTKLGFAPETLQAPVRQLGACNRLLPPLGGQLFCVAIKPLSGPR